MALSDYPNYREIAERISSAIKNDKLSHAYIIEGDSLSEKENFAVDIAKALICKERPGEGCETCATCRKINHGNYRDLYMVQSDNRSVKDKDIFQLQQDLMSIPAEEGDRNIAIVPDADSMTVRAQNRFLKTLEEPQSGTLIMLLVENGERLLPTIRSRCQGIRLSSNASENLNTELEKLTTGIFQMIDRKSYYFEVRNRLLNSIKDRKAAVSFLETAENILRDVIIGKRSVVSQEKAVKIIPFMEDAKRDIKINVNYKYALGELILKMYE